MLSFENSDVHDYGPQHSTPVKAQDTFLKTQRSENKLHPIKTTGRVTPGDVETNHISHIDDDFNYVEIRDMRDSLIDVSKISVIDNMPDVYFAHNTQMLNTAPDSSQHLGLISQHVDSSETKPRVCTKLTHTKQPFSNKLSQNPGTLEQEYRNKWQHTDRHSHTRFPERRAMPSDCNSDSDLSKQSLSPKAIFRNDDSSEMSYGRLTLSSNKDKTYRKMRSNSVPRYLLADGNMCGDRDYNLPNFSMSDFRRAPALYIEQDIINKQRKEIQLLMDELGNRDQELNDLVMSHQKQIKAWESDNEKFLNLQSRLSKYEDELKSREQQLKETLSEMNRVNEQREVDALELKQTQNEMVKLAERIMENSLYIKDIEAQNQKLNFSLREFVSARKAFTAREQEILSVIEEKNGCLADKKKELDKMSEHIKYLECHCEELGERNNNTAVESINWRKKYFQVKEEIDRLNADCKSKEENVQKLTQQLHESLQQAIALQKALFTSCEREKCKEEVMYSLRKQHKRTMQELQNIRELYDRLSCDTTLYHLSVKDKETTKDEKKKDEETVDGKVRKGKGDGSHNIEEEGDKRRQENRRKHESNMSSHKLKTPEVANEQSFLVKETKERKQSKDEKSGEKNTGKVYEKSSTKSGERNSGNTEDRNKSYKPKAHQDVDEYASEFENTSPNVSQKRIQKSAPKLLKNEQHSSSHAKSGHTPMYRNMATITSSTTLFSDEPHYQRSRINKIASTKKKCVESNVPQRRSSRLGNISKNADYQGSRSFSNSRNSIVKSMQSRTTSPLLACEELGRHNKSVTEINKSGACDSCSDVSHIVSPSQFDGELTPADSDGMCHELKRDISQMDCEQLDRLSPMLENSCLESKRSITPSNSMTLPKKSSFFRKDKPEKIKQYNTDDVSCSVFKHSFKKKAVEFDASEELSKSVSAETQSQYLEPESVSYSPPASERRQCPTARPTIYSFTQTCTSSNCQSHSLSPDGKKCKTSVNNAEPTCGTKHAPVNVHMQRSGRHQHLENDCEQEQVVSRGDSHKNSFGSAYRPLKGHNLGDGAAQRSTRSCSQCRALGKSSCHCSVALLSNTSSANKATCTFNLDLSKNDVRYSCHLAGAKLTFNEIDSLLDYKASLNQTQSRQLQSVEKGRFQMCATPDDISLSICQNSDTKAHFSYPKNESVHGQNIFSKCHTNLVDGLPERISTYLAKHLSVRKEMYNSNNSRLVDQLYFDSSRLDDPTNVTEFSMFKSADDDDGNVVNNLERNFVENTNISLQDEDVLQNTGNIQNPTNARDTERSEVIQKQTHVWTENVPEDPTVARNTERNNERVAQKQPQVWAENVQEDPTAVRYTERNNERGAQKQIQVGTEDVQDPTAVRYTERNNERGAQKQIQVGTEDVQDPTAVRYTERNNERVAQKQPQVGTEDVQDPTAVRYTERNNERGAQKQIQVGTEDIQDPTAARYTERNNERVAQKQTTQVWTENVWDKYKDTTNNNGRKTNKHSCHILSSVVENMANAAIVEDCHPLHESVVGLSDLPEKVITTQSGLERRKQNDPLAYISRKLCNERIDSTELSYFCPEECDSRNSTVRNCQLKLLHMKDKEDIRFSETSSEPSSSIPSSSSSAKGPSLYKHLSQIHFSEKTRRYEWTTLPLWRSNKESTKLLHLESHDNISANQDRSNTQFSVLNLAVRGDHPTPGVTESRSDFHRDSSTVDVTENRSDSQLSDSGHFSISGVSSGHISGVSSGHISGVSSGHISGVSSGQISGVSSGHISGVSSGHISGVSSGHISGVSSGHVSGVSSGHVSGKSSGHISGVSSGHVSGVSSGHVSGKSSGHISGVSSGLLSHNEKLEWYTNQMSNRVKHDRSTCPQTTCPELFKDHIALAANKSFKQPTDSQNKNNNNNDYSQSSINQYECSPIIETSRESYSSHMPYKHLDPVVKKLNFDETFLHDDSAAEVNQIRLHDDSIAEVKQLRLHDESTADVKHLKIYDSIHCCCQACGNDVDEISATGIPRIVHTDTHTTSLEDDEDMDISQTKASLGCHKYLSCNNNKQMYVANRRRHIHQAHVVPHDLPNSITQEHIIALDTPNIFSFLNTTLTNKAASEYSLFTNLKNCSHISLNMPEQYHQDTFTHHLDLSDEVENMFGEQCFGNVAKQQGSNLSMEVVPKDSYTMKELFNKSQISSDFGENMKDTVNIHDNISYTYCQHNEPGSCEPGGCQLHNKHIPVLTRESEKDEVRKTFDPGTFLSATEIEQGTQVYHVDAHSGHHCHSSLQKNTESSSEDIDAFSSFPEDSTHQMDESSMCTPVARLYKLLAESQEMILSLEQTLTPNAVKLKISETSNH